MKAKLRILGFLLAVLMLCPVVPVNAMAYAFSVREWIAEFDSPASARSYVSTHGGTLLGGSIVLTRDSTDALRASDRVVSLTENSVMHSADVSVNDPKYTTDDQYYLSNGPQNTSLVGVDAIGGWRQLCNDLSSERGLSPDRAATVRVAVIDSGINATHEDLAGRVVAGYDIINDCAIDAGVNSDVSGHGTAMAGLIAAQTDNGVGIAGAAYTFPVELIPVKVLNAAGKATVADIITAIFWAVDEGHADIINMSFGERLNEEPAGLRAAVAYALNKGVILTAAAGNDGIRFDDADFNFYPAAINGVLAVGSLRSSPSVYNDYYNAQHNQPEIADFSNAPKQKTSSLYNARFFLLPGQDLITTTVDGGYATVTGTSGSCALLTGFIAAMQSVQKTFNDNDVGLVYDVRRALFQDILPSGGSDRTPHFNFYKAATAFRNMQFRSNWVDLTYPIPALARGNVVFEGVFSDVRNDYVSFEIQLNDYEEGLSYTVAEFERTESAVQYFSATAYTEDVPDGLYTWCIVANSEYDRDVACSGKIRVDNSEDYEEVRVVCDGAPVACSYELRDASGNMLVNAQTDDGGNFCISKSFADNNRVIFCTILNIDGREIIVYNQLGAPVDGVITVNVDPVSFTVDATDVFDTFEGSYVYFGMPGELRGWGMRISDETDNVVLISANIPLVWYLLWKNTYIRHTCAFDTDTVAVLTDELDDCATVTFTSDATSDVGGFMLDIGLDDDVLLADGAGKVYISEGTYTVFGCIIVNEDGEYIRTAIGNVTVQTDDALSYTLGCTATGTLTASPVSPKEFTDVTLSLDFTDSQGRTVTGFGSASVYNGNAFLYPSSASFEARVNGEPVSYPYCIDNDQTPEGTFIYRLDVSDIGPAGTYTVVFTGSPVLPAVSCQLTVRPEESRPFARVFATLNNEDFDADGSVFYTLLTDDEGQEVVRKCVLDRESWEYYANLPVGQSYECVLWTRLYGDVYVSKVTLDLTDVVAGEDYYVTFPIDDCVSCRELTVAEEYEIYSLCLMPFAGRDTVMEISEFWCGIIYASGFETLPVLLNVSRTDYDGDEYKTYTHRVFCVLDFSDEEPLCASNTTVFDIVTDKSTYATGEAVTVTCDFADSFGHKVKDIRVSGYAGENGVSMEATFVLRDAGGTVVSETVSTVADGAVYTDLADGSYSVGLILGGEEYTPVVFTVGDASDTPVSYQKAPRSLSAKALTGDAVSLTWTAPDGGCAGYILYRDGAVIATLAGDSTCYVDEDTVANRYYVYEIVAVSASGATSNSRNTGVRTSSTDTEAPTVPGNVTVTPDGSSATVSWNKSTDNVSVAGYRVSVTVSGPDGAETITEESDLILSREYTVRRVRPGSVITVTVRAQDFSGNLSGASTPAVYAVPAPTVLDGVELTVKKNRLGVAIGTGIDVSAGSTSDVTSVSATVRYLDETSGDAGAQEKSLSFDLTDKGEDGWSAHYDMPFYTAITGLTVYACVNGTQAAVTEYGGSLPLQRAGYVIVTLKDKPSDPDVDLSEVYVTLSKPELCYASTKVVTDWNGTVTFDVRQDTWYTLTVVDRDGALLYRNYNVRNDTVLEISSPTCLFLGVNHYNRFEGQRVTVYSANHSEIIATGTVNQNNRVVFSNGKLWCWVNPGTNYYVTYEPFEQKIDRRTLRLDARSFYVTATDGLLHKSVDPIVYETEDTDYAVYVKYAGTPVAGVDVTFATNSQKTTVKTDANGLASTVLPCYGSSACTVSVGYVTVGGTVYVGDDVYTYGNTAAKTVSLRKCVTDFTASVALSVTEGGTTVPMSESSLAAAKIKYTVNGYACTVNPDGTFVCKDLMPEDGDTLTLKVTVTDGNRQFKAEKTATADLSSDVLPFGNLTLATDTANVTLRAKEKFSAKVRYLIYREDNGEKVADVIASGSVSTEVPSGVALSMFAVLDFNASLSLNQLKDGYFFSTATFTDGERASFEISTLPRQLEEQELARKITVTHTAGFLREANVTWLNNSTVWVSTVVSYTPDAFRHLGDCSAVVTCPAGATDVNVTVPDGMLYTVRQSADVTEIVLTPVRQNDTQNMSVRIGFAINPANVAETTVITQSVAVRKDGVTYIVPVANQAPVMSPVSVNVPPRISKTQAQTGMDIGIVSNLDDPTGWVVSVYDDSQLVYSNDLSRVSGNISLPTDSTLRFGTVYVIVSGNGVSYTSGFDYEVVDDNRPVLTLAQIDGIDILDVSRPLIFRSNYSFTHVSAYFTNGEKVKNVRLCIETQNGDIEFPMTYNPASLAFENDSLSISQSALITGAEILWDEIYTDSTVWGEIADVRDLWFTLPEGAEYEALPAEYDRSGISQAQRLEKWYAYLYYLEQDTFNTGSIEQIQAALESLFDENGNWYLPTYRTSDGSYVSAHIGFTDVIPEDAVTVLMNGEERKSYSALTVNDDGITLEIYGLGDKFFQTELSGGMSAQWGWFQEQEKVWKSDKSKVDMVKKVVDIYSQQDKFKKVDLNDRKQLDSVIDDLTGMLPYGDGNEDVAIFVKKTVDMEMDRFKEIDRQLCEAGDDSYCHDGDGDGNGDDDGNRNDSDGDRDKDPKNPKNDRDKYRKPRRRIRIDLVLDPSGYVYEVTPGERLSGVTATIYTRYGSEWYRWNPIPFGEPANPSETDGKGAFGWNTPAGDWKVVFEKDGYYPAESAVLTVPPEHMDVYVSMVASTAPVLTGALALSDGQTLRLSFDKYMSVTSLTDSGVLSAVFGTEPLSFTVAAVDSVLTVGGYKQNSSVNPVTPDMQVAKVFTVTLDTPLHTHAQIRLTVGAEAMGYNFITLGKDTSVTLEIPEQDPVIPVDKLTFNGDTAVFLTVGDTYGAAAALIIAAGDATETVIWSSSNPSVASVDASGTVTAVAAGHATVTASAEAGSVSLAVSVERVPSVPSADQNRAAFCRELNLIQGKRCWLTSYAAGADNVNPVSGDVRYVPVSWSISEDGVLKASGTLSDSETAVQVPYFPENAGTVCLGSVVFCRQVYTDGLWTPTQDTYTAEVSLPVVTVTGLCAVTVPAYTVGDVFNPGDFTLGVELSDGNVSEFGSEKFDAYGLTFSIGTGTVLTGSDAVLTVTHGDTGLTLRIPFCAIGHDFSSDWHADATVHWHECVCGEKSDLASHTDENLDGICDVCLYVGIHVPGDSAIAGVSVTLSTDIGINYYADLAEGQENAFMRFVIDHDGTPETTDVTGVYTGDGNRYVFRLTGITFQAIRDDITAQLMLGDRVLDTLTDYSVAKNLEHLLSKTAGQLGQTDEENLAMRQLIADLVALGDAAAVYRSYRTDELVSDREPFSALEPRTFVMPEARRSLTAAGQGEPRFKTARLVFDWNIRLCVQFDVGSQPDGISLFVSKDATVIGRYELSDVGNYDCLTPYTDESGAVVAGRYVLDTGEIDIKDPYAEYEFTFLYPDFDGDGQLTGQTVRLQSLTYSLGAYVVAMQASAHAEMAALARTVWNYTLSAQAYAASRS